MGQNRDLMDRFGENIRVRTEHMDRFGEKERTFGSELWENIQASTVRMRTKKKCKEELHAWP